MVFANTFEKIELFSMSIVEFYVFRFFKNITKEAS